MINYENSMCKSMCVSMTKRPTHLQILNEQHKKLAYPQPNNNKESEVNKNVKAHT